MEDHKLDANMVILQKEEKAMPTVQVGVLHCENEKALMRKVDWQYETLSITPIKTEFN